VHSQGAQATLKLCIAPVRRAAPLSLRLAPLRRGWQGESDRGFAAYTERLPTLFDPAAERTSSPQVVGVNTQQMRTNIGNEMWHTDSTYKPIASKVASRDGDCHSHTPVHFP
jgi:hypothetical protein